MTSPRWTMAPPTAAPPAELILPAKRPAPSLRPPRTVESIFRGFTYRRAALIRAITTDEEAFFRKCEPGMQHVCLYGNTKGGWEVKPPELYLPPSLPEPALGIDIMRGQMKRLTWLQEVAVHCDAWLINISFFLASCLTAKKRQRLFTMINSLPTVQETFCASKTYLRLCHVEEKEKTSGGAVPIEENDKSSEGVVVEEEVTNEDRNICASCGYQYHANGFWIGCSVCDRWYHGKCVKVTASKANHIEHYECPECRSERIGHDYDEDPMLSDLFKRC